MPSRRRHEFAKKFEREFLTRVCPSEEDRLLAGFVCGCKGRRGRRRCISAGQELRTAGETRQERILRGRRDRDERTKEDHGRVSVAGREWKTVTGRWWWSSRSMSGV